MRVALLVPPFGEIYNSYRHLYRRGFQNPPLSLCYLAGALLGAGHEVLLIDGEAAGLGLADLLDQTREFDPGLIGLTATSVDFQLTRSFAQALKVEFPDVPIILGGTHLNIFGSRVLEEHPEFDLGCIGDGEDLIVELARALEAGPGDLEAIPGLVRRDNGQPVTNPARPLETDLDRYSRPAVQLLDRQAYARAVPFRGYRMTAAVMSSRGCPYNCVYCAVKNIHGGTRVRLRSAADVLDEVEWLVNDLGYEHISFNDDCLTIDRDRIMEFCQGVLERGLGFTWEGLSRADLLDLEMLKAMRRAGFVRISIGIESGNPKILKIIRKGESLETIARGFELAKRAGIVTRGSVILGNPHETKATVRDTLRFINRLKHLDQAVVNVLQPYPGTKVREMVLAGEGGSSFVGNPEDSADLQRFGKSRVAVNDLTPEKLVSLQRWGFLRFYLRPRTILNNLRITGLKTFVQDGLGFLRSLVG